MAHLLNAQDELGTMYYCSMNKYLVLDNHNNKFMFENLSYCVYFSL